MSQAIKTAFAVSLLFSASADAQVRTLFAGSGPLPGVQGASLAVPYDFSSTGGIGLAIHSTGDLYIAVRTKQQIYRVNATGVVDQVYGLGPGCTTGQYGEGGTAANACFGSGLAGVALSPDGLHLYVADTLFNTVRRIVLATGIITTVAGTVGPDGFTGDGGLATGATLTDPALLTVEPSGDVLVAGGCRVRRFTPGGNINLVAGNGLTTFSGDGGAATVAGGVCTNGMVRDGANQIFLATLGRIRRIDAGGNISTIIGTGTPLPSLTGAFTAASPIAPGDLAIANGILTYSEPVSQRILTLDLNTSTIGLLSGALNVAAFAGDGAAFNSGRFVNPRTLAVGGSRLAIVDGNRRIRQIDFSTGLISTIAGNGTNDVSGNGTAATLARLSFPQRMVRDAAGNVFLSDSDHDVVRRVDGATGVITTYAGVGDGALLSDGDGGPATSAHLQNPAGLAIDHLGGLLIVESATFNSAVRSPSVRRVDPATGIITTVAGGTPSAPLGDGGPATSAGFTQPVDIAADGAGNIYVGDFTANRVRRFTLGGSIATVAGNGTLCGVPPVNGSLATSSCVDGVLGLGLDASGDLYMVQAAKHIVTKLTIASGQLNRFAGTTLGNSGDGGPATLARLNNPYDIAFDSAGNAFVSDNQNSAIRRVDTTGNISTVATSTGFIQGLLTLPNGDLLGAVPVESRVFRYTPAVVCTYTLSSSTATAPALGGSSSVTVITPSGCPINTPTTSTPWLSAITVLGTVVSFTAAPNNTGGFRSGSILIMGQTLTVNQAAPVSVTVQTSPPGRSYLVDGAPYSTTQVFSFEPGSSHTLTVADLTQALTADSQAVFLDWSGSPGGTRNITATNGANYVAFFKRQFRVSCTASPAAGGTVTPACGGFFDEGNVSFTAVPNSGYVFTSFTGTLNSTTSPATLNVNAPLTFVANFSQTTVTHQLNTVPSGLNVSVDGGAFLPTPRTVAWPPGSSHTLTVQSPAPNGAGSQYRFIDWTGGPATATLNVASAPASATTYTANFQRQFALALSVIGPGSTSPSGTNFYDEGTTVAVTATPASNGIFIGINGDINSTASNVNVLMDAPKTATAVFGAATFNVTLQGTGTGLVTSSPPGLINCPVNACSMTVQAAPVQLTATPNPGSTFGGWLGCPTPPAGNVCLVPANTPGGVTAQFASAGGSPNLTAARVGTLSGGLPNRLWPIRISNTGSATANNVVATAVGITATTPGCVPVINSPLPAPLGALAPGANATFNVSLDLSTCPSSATRLTLTVQVAADGCYNVSRVLPNLTR